MIGMILSGLVGGWVGGKAVEAMEKQCEKAGAYWAPDPYEKAVLRWWDGKKWTKHTLSSGPRVNEYLAHLMRGQEG